MNWKFWQSDTPIKDISNEKQTKDIDKEILKDPLERVRESMRDWSNAVNYAENPYSSESIKYQDLFNLYRNIELDTHVSALMETIFNRINQTGFNIYDKNGNIDTERAEIFKGEWFSSLIRGILKADYYGFNLMQFEKGENSLNNVSDINIFHVRPNAHGIARSMWDDEIFIDYEKEPYKSGTLFVKGQIPLGRFNSIAKRFILKREVIQFWAVYNELFTTPYYAVRTDFDNENHRNNLINWLQNRKHSGFVVVGKDDEIQTMTNSGDYEAYKDFETQSNNAMSKALIGSTMVLDDGSSRSQAEVHNENTEMFINSKRIWIENIINNDVIPKLEKLGLNINASFSFKWDMSEKFTTKEWVDLITRISQHYYIDEAIAGEKLGIELKPKQQQKAVSNKEKISNILNDLYNESSNTAGDIE